METIDRAKIPDFLQKHKQELESRFGATRLGLVGSHARGEADADSDSDSDSDSDIDLIVNLTSENSFRSFFGP